MLKILGEKSVYVLRRKSSLVAFAANKLWGDHAQKLKARHVAWVCISAREILEITNRN